MELDAPLVPVRSGRAVRLVLTSVAVVAALGVATALLGWVGGTDGRTRATPGVVLAPSTTRPAGEAVSGGGAGGAAGPSPAAATASDAVASGAPGAPVPSTGGRTRDGAKVVTTGSLSVKVERGAYGRAVQALTAKATALGGYVAESSSTSDEGRAGGTIVLRVPSERFDRLLEEARGLGEVVAEDRQGVDVTGQSVDLAARLTALRATRDRLGALLAEARDVPQILSVQDRITEVQTQIEQLDGQLRTLEDQVAMSSLTVALAEPGATALVGATGDDGLGGAWADARERFGDGLEELVAWSGSAALLLLLGGTVLVATRLARSRLRRGVP